MDDLQCVGNETRLDLCSFPGWGINNCWHDKDAGVVCDSECVCVYVSTRISFLDATDLICWYMHTLHAPRGNHLRVACRSVCNQDQHGIK